jgi:cyanophycin synthetase
VIARITRPDGWVILNADDPLVAGAADQVRAQVAFFSLAPSLDEAPVVLQDHLRAGGRAYLVRRGDVVEAEGAQTTSIVEVAAIPITLGGIARHNVANALAAAGGARAMGVSIEEVGAGLRDFRPTMERSPGRLNLFRLGRRTIIVDYAHNEAGIAALMDVAEGIAAGGAGRAAPITAIIGAAGDRPDDALEGIGRIAATHAQRIAIKEIQHYLRGRERESVVSHILTGIRSAGYAAEVPVYETETEALRTELALPPDPGEAPGARRVVVMTCHQERREVFALLDELGARPIDVSSELTELVPRLQERPRR